MCLTEPAMVLSRTEHDAIVAIDGRERVVTNLLVPDVRVGEHVLVGLGTVLARIPASEAVALAALRRQASTKEVPT